MTIVQFGLAWLGSKTDKPKELIKSLIIIQSDAKRYDIPKDIIMEFIKEVYQTSEWLSDPRILMSLWPKYKEYGSLTTRK